MFVNYKIPSGTHESRVKANIAKRQELKKKWDKHCKYENEAELPKAFALDSEAREVDFEARDARGENWTRLLDEGTVVDGDGYAYAVIRKGTLKKAFDAIPANFKGYIDKDHIRAIHLGYYGKDDLRLVKTGDGRYGIDVNVKLDQELYAVKDLIREGRHHALSVEMFTNVDEFATAEKVTGDKKQGKWLVPLIDDLQIEGFAVCENPKNANSVNDRLLENASVEKGNEMDEELKRLQAEQEEAAKQAEEEKLENEDEEKLECGAEEGSEEPEGETDGAEEGETTDEGAEGEAEDKADEDETDKLDELAAAIAELKKSNEELKKASAEKDAKIAELEAQLTAKAEVKMSTEERIAKLLAEATAAKVSAAEGAENMTANDAKDKTGDEIVAAYKAAFAQ